MQLRAAAALARAGRVGEARRVLAARLKADPADPDALRARAALDIGEGHAAEALAALATAPDTPATLADRGVALDLQAQHDAAQALYRQALRDAPDDAAIRNDLALSLLLQGRVREAIAALAPLAEAASLPARARATLALLYALDGQADRSRDLLGRPLPEDYVAQVARAVAGADQPLVAPAVRPAM